MTLSVELSSFCLFIQFSHSSSSFYTSTRDLRSSFQLLSEIFLHHIFVFAYGDKLSGQHAWRRHLCPIFVLQAPRHDILPGRCNQLRATWWEGFTRSHITIAIRSYPRNPTPYAILVRLLSQQQGPMKSHYRIGMLRMLIPRTFLRFCPHTHLCLLRCRSAMNSTSSVTPREELSRYVISRIGLTGMIFRKYAHNLIRLWHFNTPNNQLKGHYQRPITVKILNETERRRWSTRREMESIRTIYYLKPLKTSATAINFAWNCEYVKLAHVATQPQSITTQVPIKILVKSSGITSY